MEEIQEQPHNPPLDNIKGEMDKSLVHVFSQRLTDAERRNKQALRWARMITIYEYCKGRDAITAQAADMLAKMLGVSQRTVYRDVKAAKLAQEYLRKLDQ